LAGLGVLCEGELSRILNQRLRMTQRKAFSSDVSTESGAPSATAAATDARLAGGPAHKPRRPYQRPSVQKRRSVHSATLVSSGGTSGTLTSGGP
jgi:hypothetical protein